MAAVEGSVQAAMGDQTPLIVALKANDRDRINSLIENGEDVNFMWTARVAFTIKRIIPGTPIYRYLIEIAAHCESLEMVKFLLDRGARLDISNALHAAAADISHDDETERVKIVEFLIGKGLDVNRLEFAGEEDFPRQYEPRPYGTPLHYAAAWGSAQVVECLLKNSADPSIQSFCYKTGVYCGTALDWQMAFEPDEGQYSRQVRTLLGHGKDKL